MGSYLNVNYLSYFQAMREKLYEENVAVISAGAYRELDRPFVTDRQFGREDWQLVCVTKGSGQACFGDEWIQLRPGDCMLFWPGDKQHYILGGESKPDYWYVHFCGKRIPSLIENICVPRGLFHINNTAPFISICNHLMKEIQFKNELSMYYFESRLIQLFVYLARASRQKGPWMDPRIEQVVLYMNGHISEKLTTRDCAELLHVSENYFIRLFTSNMGISPGDYFMKMKIDNAIVLLESTDKSIGEIAEAVGFSDPLYFSRAFRKHTGLSPSAYRNQESKL